MFANLGVLVDAMKKEFGDYIQLTHQEKTAFRNQFYQYHGHYGKAFMLAFKHLDDLSDDGKLK